MTEMQMRRPLVMLLRCVLQRLEKKRTFPKTCPYESQYICGNLKFLKDKSYGKNEQ